jgi:hypothetical protein
MVVTALTGLTGGITSTRAARLPVRVVALVHGGLVLFGSG